jgi:hypothetical protein
MIITKLIGGLGNQMFQYATAKALALRHHVDMKVDVSFINLDSEGVYTQRKYELSIFNTPIQIATANEKEQFFVDNSNKITRKLKELFPVLTKNFYAIEKGIKYNKEFLNYPKNTYLDGFWQSELYFKHFEAIIKNDFSFNQNIVDLNKHLLSKIESCNSISLHVRRGDYVLNYDANQFHGLCSLEYYNNAIRYIEMKINNIEIFVFSDDINWCKENLRYNFPIHFMDINDAHSDLYLMTKCKHNIIANSSFSWWGAWLNTNKEKIVIAPKQWFADQSVITQDIIPASWINL